MNASAVRKGLNWKPFWTGLPNALELPFAAAGNVRGLIPQETIDWQPRDIPGTKSSDCLEGYGLAVNVLTELTFKITQVGQRAQASLVRVATSTSAIIGQKTLAMSIQDSFVQGLSWQRVLPEWRKLAAIAAAVREAKSPDHEDDPTTDAMFHMTLTGGAFHSESRLTAGGRHDLRLLPEDYAQMRELTCLERTVFVTEHGDFGIGPTDLQIGDEVCVLGGSQVPMILGEAKQDWEKDYRGEPREGFLYVGQAYVHRLMQDEGDLEADLWEGKVTMEKRILV